MDDFEVAVEARKKTMTADFAMLTTQGAYKDDFVFAVESSLMAWTVDFGVTLETGGRKGRGVWEGWAEVLVHIPVIPAASGVVVALLIPPLSTVGAAPAAARAGSSPRRTLARLVIANNAINNESRRTALSTGLTPACV